MMELCIISFTQKGNELAKSVKMRFIESAMLYEISVFTAKKEVSDAAYVTDLKEWAGECFLARKAILFIGACGIAVRTIAPFLESKLTDSPVLVMDENGQFVIPILSGHVGGANEIARNISRLLDSTTPVITTATDVSNLFSIDVFAKKHDLSVANKDGIAKVSSKVLEKKKLSMAVSDAYASQVDVMIGKRCLETELHENEPCENERMPLLTLVPREYILGIGCRRDKEDEILEAFVEKCLKEAGITWEQVRVIASIDRKKEEHAILALSHKKGIPFVVFDADTLRHIEGDFLPSAFVKEQVGVDNVCERAAIAAGKDGVRLVRRKQAENGMTLAIAKEEWRLTLYEE